MRLFDRITMLLKAESHGVVESLEERSLLLKQALREAEIAFDGQRARRDAVREEATRLTEIVTRGERDIEALDADVRLAMDHGNEELARFALRRLLGRRKEIATLRAQRDDREAERTRLDEQVTRQHEQLETLRAQVEAALRREPQHPGAPRWADEATVADEEIELELIRRRTASAGGAA